MTRTAKHSALWLGISLLLLIWLTRLVAVDSFPPFIDEMLHVHGSEQVYMESVLANADLGRQFTIWWLALFQPHLASPIWVGRVATLLAVLPGVAAIMSVGKLRGRTLGMLLAGVFYLFSAYHHFFDRLALADPVSAATVLLALFFAFRLTRHLKWIDALMTGLLLFLAFGAKVSTLPYFGIPVAAAVSLWPPERTWKQQARWLTVALVTAGGLSAAFVIVLRFFKQDFLSNSLSYGLTQRGGQSLDQFFSLQRLFANARNTVELTSVYLGPVVMVLLVCALLVLILRRRLYLPLCLMGPLLFIWASPVQESRFLVLPVLILLLIGAIVLADMLHNRPRPLQALVLMAIVAWGLGQWLPFASTAASNPVALPLPETDFVQYVYSDASGFGFTAIRDELHKHQPQRVIGLLPNCQGFRYLSLDSFPTECPPLRPDGQNREALYSLLENAQQSGTYAVLDSVPFVPERSPGQQVATFARPGGGPALTLYDLAP